MNRRIFLASTAAVPLLASAAEGTPEAIRDAPRKGSYVPFGKDRDGAPLKIGTDRVDAKIARTDTAGLYLVEGNKVGKGGPPRHVHHAQDEWFYILEGEFRFEIGDEKFTAGPGDSLFGPRMVPHVWACVSETGRMLMAVQPAGTFEAFFRELARFPVPPSDADLEKIRLLHEKHDLTLIGPPLDIERKPEAFQASARNRKRQPEQE